MLSNECYRGFFINGGQNRFIFSLKSRPLAVINGAGQSF